MVLLWIGLAGAAHAAAPVVVATRDLEAGRPIAPEDVAVIRVDGELPKTVFPSVDYVLDLAPTSTILKGEAVRSERLADEHSDFEPGLRGYVLELPATDIAPPGALLDLVQSVAGDRPCRVAQAVPVLAVLRSSGTSMQEGTTVPADAVGMLLPLTLRQVGALEELERRGGSLRVEPRAPSDERFRGDACKELP